jgi:hypothetical protein
LFFKPSEILDIALLTFCLLALRYRLGKGGIGSFYIFFFFFPS